MEIETRTQGLKSDRGIFVGRVFGPLGEWIAFESIRFPLGGSNTIEQLGGTAREIAEQDLQNINAAFLRDGWQSLPRGQYWYSYRYKRPYSSVSSHSQPVLSVSETCDIVTEVTEEGAYANKMRFVAVTPDRRLIASSSEFAVWHDDKPSDSDVKAASSRIIGELNRLGWDVLQDRQGTHYAKRR